MSKQLNTLLKEAQKAQRKMMEYQTQLESQTFSGSAGGGVVKVTVNGSKKILKIELIPDVVDPNDIEMLQDLIITAVNEAIDAAEKTANDQLAGLTGGLKIPGLTI